MIDTMYVHVHVCICMCVDKSVSEHTCVFVCRIN